MNWPADLAPLLLLASGIALLLWSRRRRFHRINKYGVERFPSFRAKLRGRIGDHAVMGSALILLTAGTITLAANHFDSWGWIVMLPVVVAMLYLLLGT
jgi:hypothetical protein